MAMLPLTPFCFNGLKPPTNLCRASEIHSQGPRAEATEKQAERIERGHADAACIFEVVL